MRCAIDVAPVRAEPADGAEQVTQVLRNEPLELEEPRDGWVRIVTAYDYPGWVRAEAIEDGDGAFPPATAADPLEAARAFLGAPYEWGGLTAAGIDCSGLVHMAHRATGRLVPRDSWQQEAAGKVVPRTEARPGDLVTYGSSGQADHIAFWLGAGRILHATAKDGKGAVEEPEGDELALRRRQVIRLWPDVSVRKRDPV